MTEAVIVVRGLRGDPHPGQRRETGDKRSSAVSARLPSIAVDPVVHTAQAFIPSSSKATLIEANAARMYHTIGMKQEDAPDIALA